MVDRPDAGPKFGADGLNIPLRDSARCESGLGLGLGFKCGTESHDSLLALRVTDDAGSIGSSVPEGQH